VVVTFIPAYSEENLPEGLVSLVKGLWEGVLAQSVEQFAPIEMNYQQDLAEIKNQLEKYCSNNQRWQKMFNQWQQEKVVLANEKLTLEQALEFAHKENALLHAKQDVLIQQLQDRDAWIDGLNRLHKQAQENLEHYRGA
jgi:uracil DNA glycosylase